jgi:hypothetical protein
LAVSAPVVCEPLVALLPDQLPKAVHPVAFVEDQLKVAVVPPVMELGVAERLTVGAAPVDVTVTVTD